ncbi:MAG: acyl-CoA dehydrogenase family protein [Acidimicrobiia bacterium]
MSTLDIEELDALRDAARGLLDRRSDSSAVRALMAEEPPASDQGLWKEMADLGWCALLVPEADGGLEAGLVPVSIVLQQLGSHVAPGPFLSSAVLATTLLASAPEQAAAKRWLPGLAEGGTIATVAVTAPGGRVHRDTFELRATTGGSGIVLDGTAHHVLDARLADVFVVGANDTDGAPLLVAVPADATITIEAVPSIDRSRPLAHVTFSGVSVGDDAVLARGDAVGALIDHFIDVAAIALAADAVGASGRALDMSVEYSKERVQFGRVIGSFQAIKHKLADMFVLQQGAEAAVEGAATGLDLDPDGSRRRSAAAGTFCRSAAGRIVGDAVQTHGGIGFTWEHDCHLLWKRAKFDEVYLTDLWNQQERLIETVLEQAGVTEPSKA